ncbi:hypothetical protein ZIOFF_040783 [Zingiber officinale]|uniref:Uncharacterized protein n=1 Tax=Zingiber officinale TaxID=94328 RepID=A0A8J5L4V2_ZINOF|nr:hypothetical protein ZIOFF_040783 [Zingiber officinale]
MGVTTTKSGHSKAKGAKVVSWLQKAGLQFPMGEEIKELPREFFVASSLADSLYCTRHAASSPRHRLCRSEPEQAGASSYAPYSDAKKKEARVIHSVGVGVDVGKYIFLEADLGRGYLISRVARFSCNELASLIQI